MERTSVSWWSLVLRGAVAIIFGILAYLMPGLTLQALVLVFGAYAVVDGVFAIASGIRSDRARGRDWLLVLGGVAGIIAGVLAWVLPGMTALVLITIIGAWAIVTGVFEIAAALRLRNLLRHTWIFILEGILSVLFGLFVFIAPGAGALALVWLIAAYAIVSGVMLVAFGLRVKAEGSMAQAMPSPPAGSPAR
jgi:uncharacterized membrane protein HdeD (DUF308 family)